MVKLKLCPFCGSKPSHWPARTNDVTNYNYNEYISCPGCDAQIGSPLSWAAINVVGQWNKRHKSTKEDG